jgi:N-acetylmuramoyl-L-alanine amidase
MNKLIQGLKILKYKRCNVKNLVLVLIFSFSIFPIAQAIDDNSKLKTVVIDPGHGGQDPGALGLKSKEKDIVLGIGLKLGKLMNENQKEVKVIFTRHEDVFIPLHERAEIANKNNADLFISIHANANRNHAVYGVETYAMGLHKNENNLEVAKKENAAITFEKDYTSHYEGYDPNSAESFIIFSLMQNTYLEQSLEFAGFVEDKFEKNANRTNRGIKQAGFLVLWKTAMPSVLIETGFVTNPEEEKFLCSEEGQEKIALAIYKAFASYKSQIDSKSVFKQQVFKNDDSSLKKEDSNISKSEIDTLVSYKVQLLTSSRPLKSNAPDFKNCKKIKGFVKVEEFHTPAGYKYTLGDSKDYKEIVNFNKEVKKFYHNAFVVAVKNGKIISLNEVHKKDK